MKIYNKKGFAFGIFWFIISVVNLFNAWMSPDSDALMQSKSILVSAVMLIIAITSFSRSLSRKASIEDYIEKNDERNILVNYKCKSRMLDIVYITLFVFMTISTIGYIINRNIVFASILTMSGFLIGIFLFIEMFVFAYYNKRI